MKKASSRTSCDGKRFSNGQAGGVDAGETMGALQRKTLTKPGKFPLTSVLYVLTTTPIHDAHLFSSNPR
jgi:hypothetical protein